jgi:hypothetical protein
MSAPFILPFAGLSARFARASALAALFLSAVLGGCSTGAEGQLLSPAAASPAHPVIGKLQARDRSVTLMSSPGGLRVTVEDAAGTVLARDVDVEALRGLDPTSYDMCRSAVAFSAQPASPGPYLDARVRPVVAAGVHAQ